MMEEQDSPDDLEYEEYEDYEDEEDEFDKLTRGEKVCGFIEEYCKVPEGALVGQPIQLADFQRDFILDIYDNPHITHTAILAIARKNAKTATIACILLAHICGPEAVLNSQIVSGAMSRDQASLVYKLAVKIINLDPRLSIKTKTVDSTKRILGLSKNVEYHALSADGHTAHGLSPILAILDEVGQIKGPTSPFVEAVTTSQGAHEDPLLIMISTQSASDADYLSLQIDDAIRGSDPGIIVHLYAAEEDCDLLDEEQWKKANPALGLFRSEKDLRKQITKAVRLPSLESSTRNLLLNQRVSLERLWLSPTVWKENNKKPSIEVFQTAQKVALGLDLSQKTDLTAAVFAAEDEETETVHLMPFCFTPLIGIDERQARDRAPYSDWVKKEFMFTAGTKVVDYGDMVLRLNLWLEENDIFMTSVEYDRWRIETLQAESEELSFGQDSEWNPVGQGFKDMGPRVSQFEELLLAGKIAHGGHPLLNLGASHAIAVEDASKNKKLDKSKTTQRIDPIVAAVMATYAVSTKTEANTDVALMIA